jgi:hypothetical protein
LRGADDPTRISDLQARSPPLRVRHCDCPSPTQHHHHA